MDEARPAGFVTNLPLNLDERILQGRKVRQRIWRLQLVWGIAWAVFCALWQPVLFLGWQTYFPVVGWGILVPLWILAGSPALTFFWCFHGRISVRRFFEMLLLFGPITSIFVGWLFWSAYVAGRSLIAH